MFKFKIQNASQQKAHLLFVLTQAQQGNICEALILRKNRTDLNIWEYPTQQWMKGYTLVHIVVDYPHD